MLKAFRAMEGCGVSGEVRDFLEMLFLEPDRFYGTIARPRAMEARECFLGMGVWAWVLFLRGGRFAVYQGDETPRDRG